MSLQIASWFTYHGRCPSHRCLEYVHESQALRTLVWLRWAMLVLVIADGKGRSKMRRECGDKKCGGELVETANQPKSSVALENDGQVQIKYGACSCGDYEKMYVLSTA